VPLWAPSKDMRVGVINDRIAADRRRGVEEYNRLLYVALTRAEDRLVVCGIQPKKALPEACWYALVAKGFARLDATAEDLPVPQPWDGKVQVFASTQDVAPQKPRTTEKAAAPEPLPTWAGHAPDWRALPPQSEPALPSPLAPSRPDGVDLGPVPEAASPLIGSNLISRDVTGGRFQRGQIIHTLLQHLPDLPEADRAEAALRWLARPGLGVTDPPALLRDVLAVLDHPALAPLFGPGSRAEAPLTGVVNGRVVSGIVDRLVILPEGDGAGRILVVDYKTNRTPPASVETVPLLYLRQMALYRAALLAAFPGYCVSCALVWTTGPRVMPLPDSTLDLHASGEILPPA